MDDNIMPMEAAAAAARREYMRRWREQHREHVNAYSKHYAQTHPEQHREACKKWRDAHRDHLNETRRAWARANRAKVRRHEMNYWFRKWQEQKQIDKA